MINANSLCNETTLTKIFDCIDQARKQGYSSYLVNRKGRNIAKCSWNSEKRSSEWYIGNRNVTKVVQDAFRLYLKSGKE